MEEKLKTLPPFVKLWLYVGVAILSWLSATLIQIGIVWIIDWLPPIDEFRWFNIGSWFMNGLIFFMIIISTSALLSGLPFFLSPSKLWGGILMLSIQGFFHYRAVTIALKIWGWTNWHPIVSIIAGTVAIYVCVYFLRLGLSKRPADDKLDA